MLTKYSNVKKSIESSTKSIDKLRNTIHDSETVVSQLRIHLSDLQKSNESEIQKECDMILNRELSRIKDYYAQERAIVTKFKDKEMEKLNRHKLELKNSNNIEAVEFNQRFNELKEIYSTISDGVLKYMSESDLEAYRNVDFGVDLINESPEQLKKRLEYFEDFKGYDMLVSGVCGIETKAESVSKDVLMYSLIATVVVLSAFKFIIVIPYIMFILSTLYIRIRDYYNLIRLIDAYLLLGELSDNTKTYYHEQVDSMLFLEDEKLRNCALHLDQICNELYKKIDCVMEEKLTKHRAEFDYERARQVALSLVEDSTGRVEETLKQEQDKVDKLKGELEDMQLHRSALIDELSSLKRDIKSVYEELTPSFKEKILISEFFMGFDKNDEPVSFNYRKRATLILYEGETEGQVDAVMDTLKMMCSQIMCSMYPLAYNIYTADTLTGGAPLSAFRVSSDDMDTDSGSTIFKVVSTQRSIDEHIDFLYDVFEKRKLQILGKYKDIDSYNEDKMKYNARTLPYLVNFFYHFDYNIIDNNEKLQQICRLSYELGIVPIFFVDISRIGVYKPSDKDAKRFDYKPEIIENHVDMFTGNIFGFSIDDVIDIITFDNKTVIETLYSD